jgi:hypothetical protein
MEPVRWGILSTARINAFVIPTVPRSAEGDTVPL